MLRALRSSEAFCAPETAAPGCVKFRPVPLRFNPSLRPPRWGRSSRPQSQLSGKRVSECQQLLLFECSRNNRRDKRCCALALQKQHKQNQKKKTSDGSAPLSPARLSPSLLAAPLRYSLTRSPACVLRPRLGGVRSELCACAGGIELFEPSSYRVTVTAPRLRPLP